MESAYDIKNVAVVERYNTVTAATVLFCYIACAFFFLSHGSVENGIYFWATAFTGVIAVPYLFAIVTKKFIFYEPIFLFTGGLFLAHTGLLLFPIEYAYDSKQLAFVLEAITYGACAFIAGYYFGFGKSVARILPLGAFSADDEIVKRLPTKLYGLWALSTVFIRVSDLMFPSISFALSILTCISIYLGLMIDIYFGFSKKSIDKNRAAARKCRARFYIFFLVKLFSSFYTGFSGQMLSDVFISCIVYLKAIRKVSIPLLFSIAAFSFSFFTVISPFTKLYREQHWWGVSFEESLKIAATAMSEGESMERQKKTSARVANNMQIALLCVEMRERGTTIDIYTDGLDFISRFIPRFIWSDKPSVNYNKIGRDLGILHPEDFETSVGIPLVGGFILSGGIFGMIVGMFVLGMLMRIYWCWLIDRAKNNFLTFSVYVILVYSWILCENEFSTAFHANVAVLVYTYFFLKFMIRKRRAQ